MTDVITENMIKTTLSQLETLKSHLYGLPTPERWKLFPCEVPGSLDNLIWALTNAVARSGLPKDDYQRKGA